MMDISSLSHVFLIAVGLLCNGLGARAQDEAVIKSENARVIGGVSSTQQPETTNLEEMINSTTKANISTNTSIKEENTSQDPTSLIASESSTSQLVTTQHLLPSTITPEMKQGPEMSLRSTLPSTSKTSNETNKEELATTSKNSGRETSTLADKSSTPAVDQTSPGMNSKIETQTETSSLEPISATVGDDSSHSLKPNSDRESTVLASSPTTTNADDKFSSTTLTTNEQSGVIKSLFTTNAPAVTTDTNDVQMNETESTADNSTSLVTSTASNSENITSPLATKIANAQDEINATDATTLIATQTETDNFSTTGENKSSSEISTRETTEQSSNVDVTPLPETASKTSSLPTTSTEIESSVSPIADKSTASSILLSNNPPTPSETLPITSPTMPISSANQPSPSFSEVTTSSSISHDSPTSTVSYTTQTTTTELPETSTSPEVSSTSQPSTEISTSSITSVPSVASRIPNRSPKWFMLQFTGNCSETQTRFDDLKKQIKDKILSVARIPDNNIALDVVNCSNNFLLNMSVAPEFEESMEKFFDNLDMTTNSSTKFRINDNNYLLNVVTSKGDKAYHQPSEVTLSSRHTDIEFVIYVALGSACAFLLALAVILVGCKYCRTKPYKSFDLNDISHLSLRLEDYTLTRIPRPKSIYADYGQGLGGKNQYSPLDDQSATPGNGMVHAYDTSVVPLEDAPPIKHEDETVPQAFGRSTQTTPTNHDYEEIDVKAVKSTENLHAGPRGSNQWGVDNVSFSTP